MSANARALSKVRSLLSKRWIDTQRLRIHVARDSVRISGELVRLGMSSAGSGDSIKIDILEREIKHIEGIRRVYLELSNWVREDSGKWVAVERESDRRLATKGFVVVRSESRD
jgi:hypothetical protein